MCLVKNITFEEKKQFLEGKLTEEEIGEVMRRLAAGSNTSGQSATTADPVFANIKESPKAE